MSDKPILLDTWFIRQRRLAMGLSQRALADKLGVNSATVKRIEEGLNHRELALAWLQRLADALDVTLAELLSEERSTNAEPDQAVEASADGQRLAAALRECDRTVSLDVLAGTFGWGHARTVDGLESLRQSLVGTGLELRYSKGGYAIRACGSGLAKSDRERLARAQLDLEGMRLSEGRLLCKIIVGGIGGEWEQRANNDDRVALYQLMKKNLIERHDARFVVAADVAYSLGLAELAR